MPDVICAGQAIVDCIIRGREEDPYRKDVYRAENILLNLGGDASNEARALAGMGIDAVIVCGLGRDVAGDMVFAGLESAGVDTSRVTRMQAPTPISSIEVKLDGSRSSVNSAATRLPGYVIDPASVCGAKVLSLASMFRPPLEDPQSVLNIVRAAKESGSVICADTKLPLLPSVKTENYSEVFPLIDYFFPNEKEAAWYSGKDCFPAMAKRFHALGVKNVIIKAGPLGCYVSGGGMEEMLPAPDVEAVDSTGAGDSFVAGFICGILKGLDISGCAELALRQAGICISHLGT